MQWSSQHLQWDGSRCSVGWQLVAFCAKRVPAKEKAPHGSRCRAKASGAMAVHAMAFGAIKVGAMTVAAMEVGVN